MTSFSVVVPVHDDSACVASLLAGLVPDAASHGAELLVVCNGCTDDSAEVARRAGAQVRVVEIPDASKPAALEAGSAAATAYPCIFVDADVRTTMTDLARVAAALRDGPVHVAAPVLEVDVSSSSWAVRRYYDVWLRQAWVRDGLVGSGVYGLSRAGLDRLGRFHPSGADDLWVSAHFGRDERSVVADARFSVPASRRLRDVVRRRGRIIAANQLIAPDIADLPGRPDRTGLRDVIRSTDGVRDVPALVLYLYVQVAARLRSASYRRRAHVPWNPDERAA